MTFSRPARHRRFGLGDCFDLSRMAIGLVLRPFERSLLAMPAIEQAA